MNRRVLILLALSLLATSSVAHALVNRVFVSARSGNNANSCDNVNTPCQTLAGAVLQLNPGGEAIVLDSGGYGLVTITQSVIIEAPPGVLAFIHPPSGQHAITVNAPGATVVLRGLTLVGAGQTTGNGIYVLAVAALHVENFVITGFAGATGAHGNGISFASVGQLFVKDTIVRGNGGAGILLSSNPGNASVDHCRLEQNKFGLVASSSAGSARVAIKDSVVSGNLRGFQADGAGGEVNAEGCLIADNSVYGLATFGGTIRVSNCTITGSDIGLFTSGGALLSRSNNTVQGNTTKGSFTGTFLPD